MTKTERKSSNLLRQGLPNLKKIFLKSSIKIYIELRKNKNSKFKIADFLVKFGGFFFKVKKLTTLVKVINRTFLRSKKVPINEDTRQTIFIMIKTINAFLENFAAILPN